MSVRSYLHPVFVVGAGRSGTAVLKRALGRHTAIVACDGEAPAVTEFALALHAVEFGEDNRYFRESLKIPPDLLKRRLQRLCFEAAAGPYFGLRLYSREIVRSRKNPARIHRWCAKTFPTRHAADCLLALYPEGRFVYIVRSGPEVVYSRSRFPSMRHLSFEQHCEVWAKSVEKYRYLADRPEALLIRHEELTREPERTFAEIQAFVGVAQEAGPAAFVQSTLVHSLDQPTKADVDVGRVFEERRAGWLGWNADQRRSFERICGRAMHELGYEFPS